MKVKTTPDSVQGSGSSKSSKGPQPISIADEPQMTQSAGESISKSPDKKSVPSQPGKKKR